MLNRLKSKVVNIIRKEYCPFFYIKQEEWEETLEQVQRHLFINHILFFKDITFENFIESVYLYVKIKRERTGKGLKVFENESNRLGRCGESTRN
jgi:hypothetical protein